MPTANDLVEKAAQFLGPKLLNRLTFRGEETLFVSVEDVYFTLDFCKKTLGFDLLHDISSVDELAREPRFDVVYELCRTEDNIHLRIKTAVAESQAVPSCSNLWGCADWHEREVFDLMGISFSNHPNLKRILMWEGYPYHPLRKDFPLAGKPTDLPEIAFTSVAPMEGGPFVTCGGGETSDAREPHARGESGKDDRWQGPRQ